MRVYVRELYEWFMGKLLSTLTHSSCGGFAKKKGGGGDLATLKKKRRRKKKEKAKAAHLTSRKTPIEAVHLINH